MIVSKQPVGIKIVDIFVVFAYMLYYIGVYYLV